MSDESLELKQLLKQEMKEQEVENYKENEINWLEGDFYDSWDIVKGHSKNLWRTKEEYLGEPPKWFFLAHSRDEVVGKPQLIESVQKRIPLVRLAIKKQKDKHAEEGTIEIQSFYFFDEKFDKRHDGFQIDAFALDFWHYKIITPEGKEVFIWTQEKLPNQTCTFKGMLVEMDDFAELSRSLKVKSISRVFFMKECIPKIKILKPEQLTSFTKDREINVENWFNYLSKHPLKTWNVFPDEINWLKSSWLLSGKVDGYPLHLGVVGPAGTKKSMGYIETTASKFSEEPSIIEGGNSRIKGLSPSFKEKPANIGYLAKQERVGFIDELGKMIEFEMNKHQSQISNVLGELNFLLDHKKRLVGSGNDNDCEVQATAKFMFVTNPISNRPTIYSHVGAIDPTTMSRIFWWIQDSEEQSFVLSEKSIRRVPPTPKQAYKGNILEENEKDTLKLELVLGGIDRDEFITLFDSCYHFISKIDDSKVQEMGDLITLKAREPMKGVWKPRAFHHVKLLIDGIVKTRCLFKDYDPSFEAKKEDYDLAEIILVRMVKGWDTLLNPKREGYN